MKDRTDSILYYLKNRTFVIFGMAVFLSLLLVAVGSSGAQQQEQKGQAHGQAAHYRVSNLLGQTVVNEQGQEIGQIYEVLVSPQGDQAELILSVGGFLGLGDKKISVQFSELKSIQGALVCDLCKADIQDKPGYDPSQGEKDLQPTY